MLRKAWTGLVQASDLLWQAAFSLEDEIVRVALSFSISISKRIRMCAPRSYGLEIWSTIDAVNVEGLCFPRDRSFIVYSAAVNGYYPHGEPSWLSIPSHANTEALTTPFTPVPAHQICTRPKLACTA